MGASTLQNSIGVHGLLLGYIFVLYLFSVHLMLQLCWLNFLFLVCGRVLEQQYPAWRLAIVVIHTVGFHEVVCIGSVYFVLLPGVCYLYCLIQCLQQLELFNFSLRLST